MYGLEMMTLTEKQRETVQVFENCGNEENKQSPAVITVSQYARRFCRTLGYLILGQSDQYNNMKHFWKLLCLDLNFMNSSFDK